MQGDMERRLNLRAFPAMAVLVLGAGCGGGSSPSATMPPPDPDAAVVALKTATPDQARDHHRRREPQLRPIFATYVPKTCARSPETSCRRTSSMPTARRGPTSRRRISTRSSRRPTAASTSVSADLKDKTLYATLPPPDIGGVRRSLPLRRHPEHSRRRPGAAAAGSVSVRHRRHGPELHARPRHAHQQRHDAAARAVPD